LKKNLRRNETKLFLFLILWIFSGLINLISQEGENNCKVWLRIDKGWIYVSASFDSNADKKVLESLSDGLKAQIFFQIKLYEKNEGFFSFLGDRLVLERNLAYISYMDFFDNKYMIQTSNQRLIGFNDPERFINNFFSINDYRLTSLEEKNISKYYILVCIHLNSVRLVAPFNLLSLFTSEESFTTQWVKKDLIDM